MENYSRQREEILREVENMWDHPTAEDIYMNIKGKDMTISRSTVYRNLNLLVNKKLINKISMQSGPDRYDYVRNPHNHVICTECGKVVDFNYNFGLDNVKELIMKDTGIEISGYGIAIEGICDSCKNKK